jgi:hypothetical protein
MIGFTSGRDMGGWMGEKGVSLSGPAGLRHVQGNILIM